MDYKKLDQLKTPEEWVDSVIGFEKEQENVIRTAELGKNRRRMRTMAAILVCVLVCGACITFVAASSDTFRAFLARAFGRQNVSVVQLDGKDAQGDVRAEETPDRNTDAETVTPDIPADDGGLISLGKEDTMLVGEKESFISVFHRGKESEENVDHVYTVAEDGLKELPIRRIKGAFEGNPFSFEYVTQNGEIYGFNQQGEVCEVFHHMDGNVVYVTFWQVEDDIVQRECIASVDLVTGKTARLSDDDMICNFSMSPNGKVILCGHSADGYWSVFDIAARTDKKVPAINGYARTDEIEYLDDYHILTLGEPVIKKNTEIYKTIQVNLATGEAEQEYDGYGEIGMQWYYKVKGRTLTVYGIINDSSFSVEDVNKHTHPLAAQGTYALFGALEESDAAFYLVNMEKQTWMKLDLPEEMRRDGVDIHLVGDRGKMLFMNYDEAKAYLVDISHL